VTAVASFNTKSSRINTVAYLLLALAIAAPIAVTTLDGGNAAIAGEQLGEMTVAFAISFLLLGLLLRSGTQTAKSYGRVVLGIGFLAWSATASFGTWHDAHRVKDAKKRLVESFIQTTFSAALPTSVDSKIRATRLATDSAALERKFAAIDLSDVLTPEGLTSRSAIATSRQKINQLQALISERNAALQRYMADSAKYFQTVDVDETTRRDALSSFNAGKGNTVKTYDELGSAQLASLHSIEEILDFAERNLGRTSVQNNQIMFQTQTQLDEYRAIFAKFQQAAAREESVTKQTAEVQDASRKKIVSEFNK
jgi:hypothetical protein